VVWQFVLVMGLVRREQGSLRWSVVKQALWLQPPRSPELRAPRRPAVAPRRPARGPRLGTRADPQAAGTREPGPRPVPQLRPRSDLSGRQLDLVRGHGRDVRLQHRPR
jgi:hypothetical protein